MLKDNREETIHFRVSQYEKKRIGSAAKKCGFSISAYARKAILGNAPKLSLPPEFDELMQAIYKAYDALIAAGRKDIADTLRTAAVAFQRACCGPEAG